jgi:tetratricopeptide (TPR) repeat protein
MTTLSEAIVRAAYALRDERNLDVDLESLASNQPEIVRAEWLNAVGKGLEERADSLRLARKEVKRLAALTKHLAQILPFTPEGWPAEHERLLQLATQNPLNGLAAWLSDWFAAAGRARLGALGRLETATIPLPVGSAQLLDRAAMAANGIAEGNWHLVEPMLAAERAGLAVHGHCVALTDRQRRDLDLLVARIAIKNSLTDVAEAALARAEARGASSHLPALRNRLERTSGADDSALRTGDVTRRLADARASDPGNFDVAVELIVAAHSAAPEGEAESSGAVAADAALDVARATVDALTSLADIDDRLALVMTDVPDEIYIAIAERAIAERDLDQAVAMLDMTGGGVLNELKALAVEHRAQVLAAQQRPISERVQALILAGDYRVQARQYDRARADYKRALALDPDDVEATLSQADVLRLSNSGGAPSTLLDTMRGVVEMVTGVRERRGLTTKHSWGYLVESLSWTEAGRYAGSERDEVLWRSLLAATRAAVHRPDLSSRWQAISDAANPLNLDEMALLCAEAGGRVTRDIDPSVSLLVAHSNAGHFVEALAMADEMPDKEADWIVALRAYLLLGCGQAEEAFRMLQGAETRLSSYWSRYDFINTLIVLGQGTAAVSAAESLLRDLEHSQDDYEALRACASAANVCGRPHDAEHWAERLQEADPRALMGGAATALIRAEAALVQDRLDDFLAGMELAVSRFRPSDASEWAEITRKRIQFLAQEAQVSLPDVTAIDNHVAEQLVTLSKLDGPRELMLAAEGYQHGPAVTTRSLLMPLLLWAQGDLEGARHALQEADAQYPGDAEIEQLREHLTHAVEDRPTRGPAAESSGVASESSRADSDHLAAVGLQLPPSWFSHLPDPLLEAPLFLRFLPEMRARLGRGQLAVNVEIAETLEPDGYVILVDEEAVATGRVSREWRYCPADAVALMPTKLSSCLEYDPALDLMRISELRVTSADAMTHLLLMSAEEVVARIVGDTAMRLADRIWATDRTAVERPR